VTDLAGQVTAALERSVRPAVIARGAALRVVSAEDGIAILENVAQPAFRIVSPGAAEVRLRQAAAQAGFPCVVKAVSLSASQGVLRADSPAAVVAAVQRIRQILTVAGRSGDEPLLVEEYVPGPELSIDGLLYDGDLTVTAIFDKPQTRRDPPSRKPC
jgi:biotin carboxylase